MNSKVEGGKEAISALHSCTCHNVDHDTLEASSKASTKKGDMWLEESTFVHLMTPPESQPLSPGRHVHQSHQQQGYLNKHAHLIQLVEATSPTSLVSICGDCIDRVASALEEDTQRLYAECRSYQESVNDAKQRAKTFDAVSKVGLNTTTKAYKSEVSMLTKEVEARETELEHLNSLLKDQLQITRQLDSLEEEFELENNALEIQTKSFDHFLQLLMKELSQVENEVDRLCKIQFPQSLFDLQVDERGLRYPLINQLRLAYHPKGDVSNKEIQVAWSQATQLLLVIGNLLNYPSSDWKLVPLADCAKLIYVKDNLTDIYNLSPAGDCRSLVAWNGLLDQVLKYACENVPKDQIRTQPPFSSSPSSIGNIDLSCLDKNDHVGWSNAIQRMASNLQWLSKFAASEVARQNTIIAHSIA